MQDDIHLLFSGSDQLGLFRLKRLKLIDPLVNVGL